MLQSKVSGVETFELPGDSLEQDMSDQDSDQTAESNDADEEHQETDPLDYQQNEKNGNINNSDDNMQNEYVKNGKLTPIERRVSADTDTGLSSSSSKSSSPDKRKLRIAKMQQGKKLKLLKKKEKKARLAKQMLELRIRLAAERVNSVSELEDEIEDSVPELSRTNKIRKSRAIDGEVEHDYNNIINPADFVQCKYLRAEERKAAKKKRIIQSNRIVRDSRAKIVSTYAESKKTKFISTVDSMQDPDLPVGKPILVIKRKVLINQSSDAMINLKVKTEKEEKRDRKSLKKKKKKKHRSKKNVG